jgi:hypothetical protein
MRGFGSWSECGIHIADVAALYAVASGRVSTMVGKLPKDFRSNPCLAEIDALPRSGE